MKTVKTDLVITIDCDDTLVMWHHPTPDIHIVDPLDGFNHALKRHERHIKLLADHYHRGYHVILWSAAGYQWAEAVAKALGIEGYVNVIMSKPIKHVDDLPANEFMGARIYLEDK